MNTSNNLQALKEELKNYHRDRKQLEKQYVAERLEKSLNTYYSDLKTRVEYLETRKPESILKRIGE